MKKRLLIIACCMAFSISASESPKWVSDPNEIDEFGYPGRQLLSPICEINRDSIDWPISPNDLLLPVMEPSLSRLLPTDADADPTITKILKENVAAAISFQPKRFALSAANKAAPQETIKLFARFESPDERLAAMIPEKKPAAASAKVYKCPTCNNEFSTNFNLKRHENTRHKGEKRFVCKSCDRKFTQKVSLDLHSMRIHSQPNPS